MTLDEAIIHCEEVAETKKQESIDAETQGCDRYALKCEKCASEHRQLANWLKELKRAKELLEATYELLEKQKNNPYVLNLLAETIFYDEAECDGSCLMEDIENLLEYGI